MLKKIKHDNVLEFRVSRTILGQPLYYNHFYFIDGLLIDCGPAHVAREVISSLETLPLEKIAITHHHEDHTGNCSLIQEHLGIPVYAHPKTITILNSPPKIQVYRRVMWGTQPGMKAIPLDKVISTGKYQIQVIDTPGHSFDHVSYFEPTNRLLFCGDLYLSEKLNGFMAGENVVDHLTSLQRVVNLKPKILFCGLKGRLTDAENRLQRKFDCWWKIGCEVKKRYEAGLNRKQILAEVFGGETFFYYLSQSNWGRSHMLDSIIENITFFNG